LSQAAAVKAQQTALQKKVDQDKLQALDEISTLMRKHGFPPELVLSLLGPTFIDKNSNPAVVNAARNLLAEASAQYTQLGVSITAAVNNDPTIANRVPARVYIEMESQQQLSHAKLLKAELEKNGYIVPDFEIVGSFRAPQHYELRYYKQEDETKAKEIVDILKNLQLDVKVSHLDRYATRVRPGHYELWLASESARGEESYLVVTAPAAEEGRQSLLDSISSVTERDKIADLSRNELVIGPFTEEQARTVRQHLIDQDTNLSKNGKVVIIKH
jgi:hypothetical protein